MSGSALEIRVPVAGEAAQFFPEHRQGFVDVLFHSLLRDFQSRRDFLVLHVLEPAHHEHFAASVRKLAHDAVDVRREFIVDCLPVGVVDREIHLIETFVADVSERIRETDNPE